MSKELNPTAKLPQERIFPSFASFLPTLLIYPSLLLVFLPIEPLVGHIFGLLGTALVIAFMLSRAPKLEIRGDLFFAGKARIKIADIEKVEVISKRDSFAERTQKLDARAYLLLRSSVPSYIKVYLRANPHDATPYWLISSRKPEVWLKLLK